MSVVNDLFEILEARGAARYGMERINQLEHALQCALMAEKEDAGPALVTAALLHDIGHLLHKLGQESTARGVNDRHERLGEKFLAKHFDEAVVQPVALHVDAKRYLCATEDDYFGRLSRGSVRSLELQGGPFSGDEADAFISKPFGADAVRLRRWDEQAKVPDMALPPLAHFRATVDSCLRPGADVQ